MKIFRSLFFLFLSLSLCSCDNRHQEVESLKNDNAKLTGELEKLRQEQKLVQTNLGLVQELSNGQKTKITEREQELARLRESYTNLENEQKTKIAEREQELARLRESHTNLEAQLARAKKDNDDTKNELVRLRDSQNQQAAQQEKAQQSQKIKMIIGKILAKLDRVLQENHRYTSAKLKSDLEAEENRLKSLSNSQKADIGELTAELEALGFQKKQDLDLQVDSFDSNYGFYASYCRMFWSAMLIRGETDEELRLKMNEFINKCYATRKRISEVKY